ncbi:hypothetical protein ACFY2R_05615 [Micromonospora olivasterospora]|uniref:Uncharacterized protein n=1 Tax=Micromonospora olivasterospora TaxID=1880 RepID=A0A562IHF7_MICOL|nr:hypothetical protein [Micromonospora olivasterospora]TWH70471.1 hypothetical protein JD77_05496 [Micromonospora olivasterospora]
MADQRFTDAEFAFLRHARFGELPARVTPDEAVELVETEPCRDRPESAWGEALSQALLAGG